MVVDICFMTGVRNQVEQMRVKMSIIACHLYASSHQLPVKCLAVLVLFHLADLSLPDLFVCLSSLFTHQFVYCVQRHLELTYRMARKFGK